MKKINYLKNSSPEVKQAVEDVETLPQNLEVCGELLKIKNNSSTKVKLDEDIKNSYYVYLNDTIYLSNKEKSKTNFQRILLLCHEVVHSVQNKNVQKQNFLFSNLEMIFFLVTVISLFFTKVNALAFAYITICIISMLFRLCLEVSAVQGSVKLCNEYLVEKLSKEKIKNILDIYKFRLKMLYPVFIFNLLVWRLLRIAIILIFYVFVK